MGTTRKSWQTPVVAEKTVRQALLGSGAHSDDRYGPPGWSNEGATIAGPMDAPLFGSESGTAYGPFGQSSFEPPVFGPALFGPQPPSPGPSGLYALNAGPFGPPPLGPGTGPIFGPTQIIGELYGPPVPAPLLGPPQPSDLRLKEDVRQIGTTAHGLPLYTFRYSGREGVYEGVMAQDVLAVRPDAVLTDADGFYSVDYGRLGIAFRRVQ